VSKVSRRESRRTRHERAPYVPPLRWDLPACMSCFDAFEGDDAFREAIARREVELRDAGLQVMKCEGCGDAWGPGVVALGW